jgi:O-acetyl-ADP-ribose deacetylase (regulator of RNase III)
MLGLRHFRRTAVDLFQGDITSFVCDGMVRVAPENLAEGDCVDDSILRIGGPRIREECRRIGLCPTGHAVITTAGDLPAKHVIHTVPPVWQGAQINEAAHLRSAHQHCLQIAREYGLGHVALPSIGTGAYGYPLAAAAELALSTLRDSLTAAAPGTWRRITFVLSNGETYQAYQRALFSFFPELEEDRP